MVLKNLVARGPILLKTYTPPIEQGSSAANPPPHLVQSEEELVEAGQCLQEGRLCSPPQLPAPSAARKAVMQSSAKCSPPRLRRSANPDEADESHAACPAKAPPPSPQDGCGYATSGPLGRCGWRSPSSCAFHLGPAPTASAIPWPCGTPASTWLKAAMRRSFPGGDKKKPGSRHQESRAKRLDKQDRCAVCAPGPFYFLSPGPLIRRSEIDIRSLKAKTDLRR